MHHQIAPASDCAREFFTYGVTGLELARATERHAYIHEPGEHPTVGSRLTPARRWLGARLIDAGQHVAGIHAPAPAAAK